MPLNFSDIDSQIELNQKRLDFEYQRYHQMISRQAYVSILYAAFSIYLIRIIIHLFDIKDYQLLYFAVLIVFLIFVGVSIYNMISLINPSELSYYHYPKHFYKDLREKYIEEQVETEKLNDYIKFTYNSELEQAVEKNALLNERKGNHYYRSIRFAIYAIIPYCICVGFYLSHDHFKSKQQTSKYFDKTDTVILNLNIMSTNDTKSNQDSSQNQNENTNTNSNSGQTQTVVIDPARVIITAPILIKGDKDTSTKENK